MENRFTTKVSTSIDALPAKVWKAITTPDLIKKHLMGTNVTSDWKTGSTITYEGEYNGKKYHDKGIIKKIEAETLFQSTYWSSMSGKEDKPENYNTVTYSLEKKEDKTILTLTQDNNSTDEEKDHSTKNWQMVLKTLKEVVENEK